MGKENQRKKVTKSIKQKLPAKYDLNVEPRLMKLDYSSD
ncbi:MAG: hypothetical protein JWQ54_2202 [Mucilaginibacter sp.]|nr:hypothetical protein [Mucilaginibacter sp.]